MFEIRERDVPEQVVLSESHQHLRQPDLTDRMPAVIGRLINLAEENGGLAGNVFVIFPDREYDENDINLEACIPIHRRPDLPLDAIVRVEPAHHEAYVRLRKSQFVYPAAGEAYRAVLDWVSEHDRTVTDSPREIYIVDVLAAAPEDEVVDIAFPIR